MKRPILKYLLITTGFAIAWILLEHVLGFNTTRHDIGQFTRNATVLFFWVTIFITIRETKIIQGNQLTFRQGMLTGIMYSLLFSALFACILLLYVTFVNPDFYQTYKTFTLDQLHAANATEKQIEAAMNEVDMSYDGSFRSYALLFLFSSVFGTGVSLVATLLYRTKKKP